LRRWPISNNPSGGISLTIRFLGDGVAPQLECFR